MRSSYSTREDMDATLEMHTAYNRSKQNNPTGFTFGKFIRKLPVWKRTVIKWLFKKPKSSVGFSCGYGSAMRREF